MNRSARLRKPLCAAAGPLPTPQPWGEEVTA